MYLRPSEGLVQGHVFFFAFDYIPTTFPLFRAQQNLGYSERVPRNQRAQTYKVDEGLAGLFGRDQKKHDPYNTEQMKQKRKEEQAMFDNLLRLKEKSHILPAMQLPSASCAWVDS